LESMAELQDRVKGLLGQVTCEIMRRVYEHSIRRMNQVINCNKKGETALRLFYTLFFE
jgi:hypothetical protein